MTSGVLNYHDVDVYERDVRLFEDGGWVNDACINFCMKRFELELQNHAVLFMDAAVVSFLRFQLDDDDEMNELRTSLAIEKRKWALVPINDCRSLSQTGSHWSMLAFDTHTGLSVHMDSNRPHNDRAASDTAHKLAELAQRDFSEPAQIDVPQQENGYDCGIYTVLFARALANYLTHASDGGSADLVEQAGMAFQLEEIQKLLTPSAVTDYRHQCSRDLQDMIDAKK